MAIKPLELMEEYYQLTDVVFILQQKHNNRRLKNGCIIEKKHHNKAVSPNLESVANILWQKNE